MEREDARKAFTFQNFDGEVSMLDPSNSNKSDKYFMGKNIAAYLKALRKEARDLRES